MEWIREQGHVPNGSDGTSEGKRVLGIGSER